MVAVDRSMTIFVTERHTAYQYAVLRLTQFLFHNLGIFYKRGLWAGHWIIVHGRVFVPEGACLAAPRISKLNSVRRINADRREAR